MGNLGSNMQGQGSWDGISGMDPAVQVEHVVWHIFGMNAVCKKEIKFLDKSREPYKTSTRMIDHIYEHFFNLPIGFPTYCLVVTITLNVSRITELIDQCKRNTDESM